jgi:hypothetical protein
MGEAQTSEPTESQEERMAVQRNQTTARTPVQAANGEPLKGYPLIEALLDREDFDTVNKSFKDAYDRLEKRLSDKSLGLSGKKKVRAAMKSYELTVELIRELLALKYQMVSQQGETPTPGGTAPLKNSK